MVSLALNNWAQVFLGNIMTLYRRYAMLYKRHWPVQSFYYATLPICYFVMIQAVRASDFVLVKSI